MSRACDALNALLDGVCEARGIAAHEVRLSKTDFGPLAQLGERLLCKQEVAGSIPAGSKIARLRGKNRFLFFDKLYVSRKDAVAR